MTKQKLEQYVYLLQEQKHLATRIEKIKTQLDKLSNDTVVDKVRGGEGNYQTFKIEGFAEKEYWEKRKLLLANLFKIEKAEKKALSLLNEIEDYLATVDDYLIKRIIRLRVIENLSWKEISKKIGGGNTEDSVKKMYYRHFL